MEGARSFDAFGNGRDHGLRHFVLDCEYIIETPIIPLCSGSGGLKMRQVQKLQNR
jgi:hypothetical protein